MWGKKKKSNTLVLSISPHCIRTLLFQSNTTQRPFLTHYQKHTLNHLECEHLILFNPTRILKILASLRSNHIIDTTHIILNGPSFIEQFISLPFAHPTLSQFPITYEPTWLWEYQYLYPHDHEYCFYVCGIQKPLLLQYQLLAMRAGLDLRTLTTERIGLLKAYRHLFGVAFRRAHLANDLLALNNQIERLFTKDDLARTISIAHDSMVEEHDMIPLLAASGIIVGNK